jgi:hypothetical protein
MPNLLLCLKLKKSGLNLLLVVLLLRQPENRLRTEVRRGRGLRRWRGWRGRGKGRGLPLLLRRPLGVDVTSRKFRLLWRFVAAWRNGRGQRSAPRCLAKLNLNLLMNSQLEWSLMLDGQTDRHKDRWTDGQMDRQTAGQTD